MIIFILSFYGLFLKHKHQIFTSPKTHLQNCWRFFILGVRLCSFLNLVKKYTDIKELDQEIIRTFVDKIYVEQLEKVPGTNLKKQTIWIYWNFIGKIDI
ncbi:MAG: DUF4368 domain-containing protein [Peptoniphilus sp.]|uniref:DUF4368 domain-containing protein n=1 Tax=Peptoniphilus sp. TaxID=1971214 RepID=UPI0039A3ACB3